MKRSLIAEYQRIHKASGYGATAHKSLPHILPHILALSPQSIIDYGCGQSDLVNTLGRKMKLTRTWRFDPAIPCYSELPSSVFDLLICIDVMEHIPEEEIDEVATEMAMWGRHALFVIDTGPAVTMLSDGSNAHASQHDESWWLERLRRRFPSLRPMRVRRKRRIGLKTFDAELPLLIRHYVKCRETLLRHAHRLFLPRVHREIAL